MAISIIATVSADAGSGNPSITHGLTILSGDKLVAIVNANGASNTVTDNNGSTAFTNDDWGENLDSARTYIFSRVAGSSEPSSYNWTLGSSNRWSVIIQQTRGVDDAIWDVAPSAANRAIANDGDATAEAPAITIATSGAMGMVLMGDDLFPTTTTFSSVNNSYTNAVSEAGQQLSVIATKEGLSTGSTGVTTITCSANISYVIWQVALKPATATLEQEGFAFGDDDNNEASHTLNTQDTNISTADATTKLIRLLANATGDPAAIAYKLKYQKNGSGGYGTVPIGATVTTSPPTAPTATVTTVGTAAATWAINRSTGSSGDLIVFVVAWDDSTTVSSVSLPTGVNSETAVSIVSPIASASTEMRMQAWYYIATGTWGAGTLTFTPSASETCRAVSFTIPAANFNASDPIGWANTRASAGTAETNVNSPTGTAEADDGDGRIYIAFGSDADALTVPGSNWNTINNSTGGGVGLAVGTRDTLASNSESVTALTATIASDSWASIAFVVKPKITTNDLYISTSGNITAGGEDTTARLTAPSGKTTSDFVTGRRWDNENGTDTINITTDDYTEVEWCLTLRSGLTGGDYFDFRVYNADVALDTYTVTPRWTISSGVSIVLDTATITALGRALTLVPGAVSKTLSTASLSATGRAFTVVPGAFSLLLDTASLLATGQASTIVPGAATTLLDTAALLANGQAFTVVPGAFTLTLDTATLTATGQIIQVGNINTILLDTATLSANGQAVTLIPGAISTLLDTALLTLNGQAFTVIPGAATRTLSTALLSASGQVLDVIPGAVTKALSTALLSALGQGVTLVPGAVTIAMDTAQINASGIAITIQSVGGAVTVILDTATLLAGGIALDVIPGDISTLLDTAQLTASGIQSSVIPGGVIIGLDTAALLATGQGLTLDVVLQAVVRAWTLQDRDTAWTLENRATGWTLRNRDTEWSLDDRDTDWSLRGRKTDWTIDDR